jgi:hypothetical protein
MKRPTRRPARMRPENTTPPERPTILHGLPWCPCGRVLRPSRDAGEAQYRCGGGHAWGILPEAAAPEVKP